MHRALLSAGQKVAAFWKKRRKNFFVNWAGGDETSTAQFKKVFCFFFSKKKPFFA
jgi:hypothetical protein